MYKHCRVGKVEMKRPPEGLSADVKIILICIFKK
jgi:hypothetical protein